MFCGPLRIIQFIFIFAFTLLSGSRVFAVDGPSFDCSQGVRQTLAVILCVDPEAAQADWDVSRAYWALYTTDREETTFNQMVIQRCALPRLETAQERAGRIFVQQLGRRMGPGLAIPTPQPVTQQHARCVISEFHNRAAALRSRLTGDALAEANLSPDEHVDIQVALARKGFMLNRIRDYGANADGQFGPNTRSAIKDFQRSTGAQATGFLSSDQRLALVESPEEREARTARAAAAERSRQEALEAQKQAEAREKEAAIERERKHLEDEAAKAVEWRRRIDEAQKKGTEYAQVTDLKWSLQESTNPMTDEQDYVVSSAQTNGVGALAQVEGICSKNEVVFETTLHNSNDPKVPLGFGSSSSGGIVGHKRINDDSMFAISFPRDKWQNRIVLSRLSFSSDDAESADTTWRVLTEIETSRGTLYIKIPMLDPKIQKLIANCKHRYEIEKRRMGSINVPG
jgi:peptidoglycan hydrolase-like protein with peptidoglycan-binding domain